MALPAIALQEWAVTCRALADGRTILAVRKGGIHERGGGLFAPEHPRFWLMPTYLHQDASRLGPESAGLLAAVAADPAPGSHRLAAWAEVAQVWKVTDLARLGAVSDELIWTAAELEARFRYRDQPWLFVLALRVQRVDPPVVIPDAPRYAGCRSWIPLQDPPRAALTIPAVAEADFSHRLAAVAAHLDAPLPALRSPLPP